MRGFLQIIICLFWVLLANADQKEISLNGNNWVLSDEAGRVKELQATVPGIVHTDLLRHNIIEDPYYGFNDQKLQWIAYSNWTYTLDFSLTSDFVGKHLVLKCNGIDTVANVSLNNVPVGYAYNYYRRWLFDVTDAAKKGENILTVRIQAAANYSMNLKNRYPYDVPAPGIYIPDTSRNFIRKPQSDFGWDWGPAFVPAGIWQDISIISYDNVVVSTIVPKTFFDEEIESYMIEVLVCVDMKSPGADHKISVSLGLAEPPFNRDPPMKWSSSLDAGQTGQTCFRVYSKPYNSRMMDQYLWRPYSSISPTPILYNATVSVSVSDMRNNVLSTVNRTRRIGFRNIVIKQDPPPDKSDGLLFYFEQSDSKGSYPIYAKGSNFIPMDAFISRATPDVAKRLLTSAIIGNQNMIRIWGGGLYQPNWFYDMCDEMGILVWQEFMFAVALYPRDNDFLDNIRMEVRDTVRRIGYHPSIVLWSGNNENQGYATTTAEIIDYSLLYDRTVRATLWEEDTTRAYWPSSPSNGAAIDDKEMGIYIQRWGDSQNTSYGDIHRYDYFDLCTDVKTYPRPRFASEFGFQSYPSFPSLQKVSGPSDWDNDSPLMNHRQHHPDGNKQLVNLMSMIFKLPKNSNSTIQFQDFVYLTQVVQSICITSEAEHYRRILSETGYTRGTLYWQLNDIWQAQSWASVEYSGRWKLLHYGMKKVYAEVMVSAYELDGFIVVYVVNDQPTKTVKYDLKISTIKWIDGSTVDTYNNVGLNCNGFTGVSVYNKSVNDAFIGTSINESFLYISINETGTNKVLSDEAFFPYNFTVMDLPKAVITISNVLYVATTIDDYSVIKFSLTTSAVAPYLYLDSGNIEGYFSDNGMLVMPGVQYNMTFTSWQPTTASMFKNNIKTRTISDTY